MNINFESYLKDNFRPATTPDYYLYSDSDYPLIHIDDIRKRFKDIQGEVTISTDKSKESICPTCGGLAEMYWTGLELVQQSGNETLATKNYRTLPTFQEIEYERLKEENERLKECLEQSWDVLSSILNDLKEGTLSKIFVKQQLDIITKKINK